LNGIGHSGQEEPEGFVLEETYDADDPGTHPRHESKAHEQPSCNKITYRQGGRGEREGGKEGITSRLHVHTPVFHCFVGVQTCYEVAEVNIWKLLNYQTMDLSHTSQSASGSESK
jgi:hypothetical protein